MDLPGLDHLRLPQSPPEPREVSSSRRPPRHRKGEHFLKGPVPCTWLEQAAVLPGKALHIGLALWFMAGMTKSQTVKLSRSLAAQFGTLPDASRRALSTLEKAGLVSVIRHPGRSPVVTLLEVPAAET